MKTTWKRARRVVELSILIILCASPLLAGGIAVRSVSLTDNGDNDGFADTLETVSVNVTVENTSGQSLTNVTLRLYELQSELGCLTTNTILVGNLPSGAVVQTTAGAVFTVADVDRATLGLGPFDDLSVEFKVTADSNQGPVAVYSPKLRLDLDLNVSGGSGSTSYFESFEDGMGSFEVDNIDAGHGTLADSDGYRCQYNDPAAPNSNSGPSNANCHMGPTPEFVDGEIWGLSGPAFSPAGGRGFSGFHSLFYGIDLGPPLNWTTPLASLEAARMSQPVHIAADAVEPTLIFKHQSSFADSRAFALPYRRTYDAGVVMIQVADDQGDPAGPWFKVDPYRNPYDQQNHPHISNCGFDPIDDGSTEDDYFAPTHPDRRYGRSSTCYPEFIFANMGDTQNTYDPANLGLADGPGLQGLWGIGTWVESRVDLSRYRGRSIRVRYLASTLEGNVALAETWEEIFPGLNPVPGDDGWWVDDVEITELVTTPPTVIVDSSDNSGLPPLGGNDADSDGRPDACDNCPSVANADQWNADSDEVGDSCDFCPLNPDNSDPDMDLICSTDDNCELVSNPDQMDLDSDGWGTVCDCNDADAGTNPDQFESNDGIDNDCSGDTDEIDGVTGFLDPGGDPTLLSWSAQANAARYQIQRSTHADFSTGCTPFSSFSNSFTDTDVPASGTVFNYLVRSVIPNPGSWGLDSDGVERILVCAP
ncbi:MAG: MopE-related protein [Acidobacteriota bacterium]|nr:MopE-related protein [Acidobacteriota bacterium]MDH3784432.1 MopE-related protein [Acidobacteriota bacterium]